MDELTSIFSSQPNDNDDLMSKYKIGRSSGGSSGSIFGGAGTSNKSVFDNISEYGKAPSSTESAFMSSASSFSSVGSGSSLADNGMNGAYEEKGSISNMLNIKASNQTQLSLTNSLRGIQAKRLDIDNGEVSIAEMYNDSALDTRVGGGQYNITITDIYKDKKLFMGFHGLHTDGKIDDNDVDITNNNNINQSLISAKDNNGLSSQSEVIVTPYKKFEIVNMWDKQSKLEKDDIAGESQQEISSGMLLTSVPSGLSFIANNQSTGKLINGRDGFKGSIRELSNTGISDILNDNKVIEKKVDKKTDNNPTDFTNEWNKKALWDKESKEIDSSNESKKNNQMIKGSSGYEIKDDKTQIKTINESVDQDKKNDYLDEEVSKIKISMPSPNIIDYNNYIENISSDFMLNIFEYKDVKIGTLQLTELISLKEKIMDEQKITLNKDYFIILFDNITKAIIKKSF